MLQKLTSAKARMYLYIVGTAAVALLVYYKIIAPQAVPLWLALAAAVLALGAPATAAGAVIKQRKDGTLP